MPGRGRPLPAAQRSRRLPKLRTNRCGKQRDSYASSGAGAGYRVPSTVRAVARARSTMARYSARYCPVPIDLGLAGDVVAGHRLLAGAPRRRGIAGELVHRPERVLVVVALGLHARRPRLDAGCEPRVGDRGSFDLVAHVVADPTGQRGVARLVPVQGLLGLAEAAARRLRARLLAGNRVDDRRAIAHRAAQVRLAVVRLRPPVTLLGRLQLLLHGVGATRAGRHGVADLVGPPGVGAAEAVPLGVQAALRRVDFDVGLPGRLHAVADQSLLGPEEQSRFVLGEHVVADALLPCGPVGHCRHRLRRPELDGDHPGDGRRSGEGNRQGKARPTPSPHLHGPLVERRGDDDVERTTQPGFDLLLRQLHDNSSLIRASARCVADFTVPGRHARTVARSASDMSS